jgi:hypothetical protein
MDDSAFMLALGEVSGERNASLCLGLVVIEGALGEIAYAPPADEAAPTP